VYVWVGGGRGQTFLVGGKMKYFKLHKNGESMFPGSLLKTYASICLLMMDRSYG
jgi:hypothetical protein